jgi:hypothetical protein
MTLPVEPEGVPPTSAGADVSTVTAPVLVTVPLVFPAASVAEIVMFLATPLIPAEGTVEVLVHFRLMLS